MPLIKDNAFIDASTSIPALGEFLREPLIRALFTRDESALPREVVSVLNSSAKISVKIKNELELLRLSRVASGQESTMSLGLPAEDYHYFRRELGVRKDQNISLSLKPRLIATYDWIIPPQGGIQVDLSELDSVEFHDGSHTASVQCGARWKVLYDEAKQRGLFVPFFPSIPLDFAMGDALYGDARFCSYYGEFSPYLNGYRAVTAHGLRARIGFENVPSHSSGYDLRSLISASTSEFVLPTALFVRLQPRAKASRNLVFNFDDLNKLVEGLDKITRSGRDFSYVNLYDDRSWPYVHGSSAASFALELGLGGSENIVAIREKALDSLLAGFKEKSDAITSPYETERGTYAKTSEKISRQLFLGEIRCAIKVLPTIYANCRGFSERSGVKFGVFGTAHERGYVVLHPFFEAPKERARIYDLSKGFWELLRREGHVIFISRLTHLWLDDSSYRSRIALLTKLKADMDSSNIVEPLAQIKPA